MRNRPNRLALVATCLGWWSTSAAQPLPALNIDPVAITVSGLSSGGFMAVQLHVAYSSVFSGAGVVAGGPYACASGTIWPRLATATTVCMDLEGDFIPFQGPPKASASVDAVHEAWARGVIDDPVNLGDDAVYLFSGGSDITVPPAVMESTRMFYAAFVDPGAIRFDDDANAGHGLPTLDQGVECDATGTPYLNDCDLDTAGTLLRHLYGEDLRAPADHAPPLATFSQSHYVDDADPAAIGMGQTGYAHVPTPCTQGARCRLHVALHGCRQHADAVGTAFVDGAGYDRWAQANEIVVLYPQAQSTSSWWPDRTNPRGCWDWWGYTGRGYFEQDAPQMRAIANMVGRLTASRPTN